MKYITKYQLVDKNTGDNVLEPFFDMRSARYLVDTYFTECMIVEVEIECDL